MFTDQSEHPPDVVTLKSQCVQLVPSTGIETVLGNYKSLNHHQQQSEPYCGLLIQRLSLIYLVKEHSGCRNQTRAHRMRPCLRSMRVRSGGAMRDRTADLLRAKQALSQLSYSPIKLGRPGQI